MSLSLKDVQISLALWGLGLALIVERPLHGADGGELRMQGHFPPIVWLPPAPTCQTRIGSLTTRLGIRAEERLANALEEDGH